MAFAVMTGGRIGVAIVDDDPGFAATLAELLELEPELTVVGTANSVTTGIELLGDRRVQLAFVDVQMPDGGGLRIVDEVHGWDRTPRIALISANPPTASTRRSGHPFLSKGELDPDVLRRLVLDRSVPDNDHLPDR